MSKRFYRLTLFLELPDTEAEPRKWDWDSLLFGDGSDESYSASHIHALEQSEHANLNALIDGQARRTAELKLADLPNMPEIMGYEED